jgi:dTDP-4-dehydrorhamnose 3,5-epimerase
MIFRKVGLGDACLIQADPVVDDRGFFARTWCKKEFGEQGLNTDLVQCNVSRNRLRGTLRGMHLQVAPHREAKLVRCTRGEIYDVIIDLRRSSPTFKKHYGVFLRGNELAMLYVPEGFAHGFLTMEDDSEVFYQMSEYYSPAAARGVRWDDPAFGIQWPGAVTVISERDRSHPPFDPADGI